MVAQAVPRTLMDGLDLFEDLLSEQWQTDIMTLVTDELSAGRAGESRGKVYTPPPESWLRKGQGREMVQFGVYTKCNKVVPCRVPPLPPLFQALLDLLQTAGVFREDERPDTCTVNVYAAGSWLPPHVDSCAFERPFFTVSLVSAQEVVFGDEITGEQGDWHGPLRFKMGVGSVLRLSGEAAGPTCRHALPTATERRVSLTFRRLGRETRERFDEIRRASEEATRAKIERRQRARALRTRVKPPSSATADDDSGAEVTTEEGCVWDMFATDDVAADSG
eukprot:TRINITY_DN38402_c0_g1_i1.p1 TRINITY_DN38402_c0_g1~~TRINITY_DN38402_c0_g1_i1.p1  ORF type:complete len:278 (-),score=57.87 TRINITY_DN38402_c0_g1_i1:12-845(-)